MVQNAWGRLPRTKQGRILAPCFSILCPYFRCTGSHCLRYEFLQKLWGTALVLFLNWHLRLLGLNVSFLCLLKGKKLTRIQHYTSGCVKYLHDA